MTCSRCQWYDHDCNNNHGESYADGYGRCRKHPPTVCCEPNESENIYHTLWPSVYEDDYCGEFEEEADLDD